MDDLINNLAAAIEDFEGDISDMYLDTCCFGVVEDNREHMLELH
jgi:hypothetical protein